MKKLLFVGVVMVLSLNVMAQERENTAPFSSSPNPVSAGSRENAGVSDGPLGPNEVEKEEVRNRAGSMGGAPNAGGGMGTGTGAGSRVGNPVKGTMNAGSSEGAAEE